jgi:rhodanese-related sulfurtransferase
MAKKILLVLALILPALVACGAPQTAEQDGIALDLGPTVSVDTVAELKDRSDVLVLDVREQWEYDEGHIPGVTHIPMNEIPNRLSEIPAEQTVLVTCRSGNRSGQVAEFLRGKGYENVHNMDGGILAWEAAGYPVDR